MSVDILTSTKAFPENLRDSTGAKEVLSFNDLAAWVALPSVVLWQHIHTKYIQVPKHIGSEVILRASLQDLRAYREFVRVGRNPECSLPLTDSSPLAPPAPSSKPPHL